MDSKPPTDKAHELDWSNVSADLRLPAIAAFLAQRVAGIEFQLAEQNRLLSGLLKAFGDGR
jgi:hypothetical protein